MAAPDDAVADNIEVEWQLDALDLRLVERYLAARTTSPADGGEAPLLLPSLPGLEAKHDGVKRLNDGYFDTADWRIARSGHVLRARQRGARFEATLKDRAASTDGLRRRLEVTEALASPELAAFDPAGPVGRRVTALVGDRKLVRVLEVRTRRNTYSLMIHGASIGEVALDDTVILVGSDTHRIRLQRVEVEVSPAWVEQLAPLVERLRIDCGLQPATLSKFEAGILAAGVTIPPGVDLGSTAVTPDSTIAQLAFAVLRKDAAQMLTREPGTRLGDDAEDLHQMRVATRRMRAALALFSDYLPVRSARIREELGWLAGVLGAVRDLDIQLENLDGWTEHLSGDHQQALDELRDLLERHHVEARTRLLEALDSRRYDRLVTSLTSMLDTGPTRRLGPGQQLALLSLPDLIAGREAAAAKAARRARKSGAIADFHALRIRCKRLRYAIEFTGDLYKPDVKKYSKEIAGLQDALGLVQDAEAATLKLQELASGPESALLPRATIFAMGMIAERCSAEAHGRLSRLSLTEKSISSPGWRKAAAVMADTARAAAERVEEKALAAREAGARPDPAASQVGARVRSALPGATAAAAGPSAAVVRPLRPRPARAAAGRRPGSVTAARPPASRPARSRRSTGTETDS
ncbi:MAG TPA: CHAD domain-containing protein [Acidimicrobiales bacterium]|nr:CHAD domain-containing protein [Acidimicrobiales bacterium]